MSDDPMQTVLAALARLEAGQISLRVDLMARMDRLENRITAVQSDIAVNFGAADTVKRAHDNTREELRGYSEILMEMVRKVRILETRVREITGDS
jgi:hypothetical protein